jgi:hypothetical protein
MALYGTVVNGVVVIDGPPLPEGTRVRVGLEDDDPIPPLEETHEEFLRSLRDSITSAESGNTRPAEVVLRELAERHDLPHEPWE